MRPGYQAISVYKKLHDRAMKIREEFSDMTDHKIFMLGVVRAEYLSKQRKAKMLVQPYYECFFSINRRIGETFLVIKHIRQQAPRYGDRSSFQKRYIYEINWAEKEGSVEILYKVSPSHVKLKKTVKMLKLVEDKILNTFFGEGNW